MPTKLYGHQTKELPPRSPSSGCLDEYTKHTIESLVRGDPEVVVGTSAAILEKYEKGKREAVEQGYVR